MVPDHQQREHLLAPAPAPAAGLRRIAELDPRSLACLRIGLGLVLLWDMARAFAMADDWVAMQGYPRLPLPAALVLGSETATLRLAIAAVASAALALLLGWRTRLATWAAWCGACAYQYAASATADYHDAALCALLLWGLALPLGERWSLDARAGRRPGQSAWLRRVGAAGLLLSLAWIYLSTAASKTGAAWWPDGSALWLALCDRATQTDAGRWAAANCPAAALRVATYLTLALEWTAPALILWPSARATAALLLGALHAGMWALMDLGSFPLVMLSAAAALLPAGVWERGSQVAAAPGRLREPAGGALQKVPAKAPGEAEPVHRATVRWRDWLTAATLAGAIAVTAEGERVAAARAHGAWPYCGAAWVARLKYVLGTEVGWRMYSPTPHLDTGWWVGVGWRGDGLVVDPIAGAPPCLAPPPARGPVARLRWLYLSDAPYLDPDTGSGDQHAYRNFLLARRNAPAAAGLRRLALVWVYEPLEPLQMPARQVPLLVLTWPADSVSAGEVAAAVGAAVYQPLYDGDGNLAGSAAAPLSAPPQSVP